MTVPDYQTLMLPALQQLGGGETKRVVPEIADALADHFHLTDGERGELLPSGSQTSLVNRTHWAITYMVKAGLVERPSRGRVRLTPRGAELLRQPPDRIGIAYLRRYPEFLEFLTKSKGTSVPAATSSNDRSNPEELLYETYDALRQSVEADILDRLQADSFTWDAFERLVVDVLSAMGYGSSRHEASRRVTRRSNDEGIDGVINQDRLGLDAVYVQAKKYGAKNGVGRPALQGFAGSLEGQRADKGVFITTSHFSSEATDYVRRVNRRIVLIDRHTLARYMYDHGVGVRSIRTLDVKQVDEAFFEGEI